MSRLSSLALVLLGLSCFLSLARPALAHPEPQHDLQYVTGTNAAGQTVYLPDNRQPSLYTGNFGDCLGNSDINVTRFDAAYYKDNMTVLFHLAGTTALKNESLMMYIGVYAYGESRFELTFNPCYANIFSLCPMNSSVPIEANGIIPVAPSDVANIPPIALTIPDFEGQAILRMFANSTEEEIGCFSAVVTNGKSFSQPVSVGIVLGAFAMVAMIASFASAFSGTHIPTIRTHYGHSMSLLLVIAVYQHIFFTGALSMNWPSVLVAWWSNFAWAGGMIYSSSMQSSIDKIVGRHVGNTSEVGAAAAGASVKNLGGGYDITKIYRRTQLPLRRDLATREFQGLMLKRELANASEGYKWYGKPVGAGLPLPGNYSGFAGTLADEMIPASNAFMTGLLWFLILLLIIGGSLMLLKFCLEVLVRFRIMKQGRLALFRRHWFHFLTLALSRTLYISFFMMTLLALFQFTYTGSSAVIAIAVIVFLIYIFGVSALAVRPIVARFDLKRIRVQRERLHLRVRRASKFLPSFSLYYGSEEETKQQRQYDASMPFPRISCPLRSPNDSVHDDDNFVRQHGWLTARFRKSRWCFYAGWTVYEFVRACFYGGASNHPMTQVFGLLAVEIISFVGILIAKPFEAQRLNALAVYFLGFSKVATLALASAFDISFGINRIAGTAIGIIIIVIQGSLVIILFVAIIVGAISSYMSVSRNVPNEDFKPKRLRTTRTRYFAHINRTAAELPRERTPKRKDVVRSEDRMEAKQPYFSVNSVRRVAKIEDEDPDNLQTSSKRADSVPEAADGSNRFDMGIADGEVGQPSDTFQDHRYYQASSRPISAASAVSAGLRHSGSQHESNGRQRTSSVYSARLSTSGLPYGARPHRASWSTRDFDGWNSSISLAGNRHSAVERYSRDEVRAAAPEICASAEQSFAIVRGEGSNLPQTSAGDLPIDAAALPPLAFQRLSSEIEGDRMAYHAGWHKSLGLPQVPQSENELIGSDDFRKTGQK